MNENLEQEMLKANPPYKIDELDESTILDKKIFEYIFSITNQISRTEIIVKLEDKAKQLGLTRSFGKLLKAYQTEYAQQFKQKGSNGNT